MLGRIAGFGASIALLAALMPLGVLSHPAASVLSRGASGLRLRAGKHDACGSLQALSLRGGGVAVPGVSWSQRADSLMLKVEIPAGSSLENLNLAGDGDVLEWKDEKAELNLALHDKLDHNTLTKSNHGGWLRLLSNVHDYQFEEGRACMVAKS